MHVWHRHRPFSQHASAILVRRAARVLSCPSLSARSPSPRPFRAPDSFSPPKPKLCSTMAAAPSSVAAAGEVLPNLAHAPPSPPHPRPVWALTQPPPPPCWAAGERLRPPPPFVVAPPRRCSSTHMLLSVSLADSGTTPCAPPLPFFGLASPFRRPSAPLPPLPHAHALAAPRHGSRLLVGLDLGWWAAGPWAPPVSLRAGWPWCGSSNFDEFSLCSNHVYCVENRTDLGKI